MDRTLITAADWKALVKKGASGDDLAPYVVFKSGLVDLSAMKADPESRTIPFVLSNANLDREGDSLAVKGWDLKDYKTNPVVLWAHDHGALPVGRALETINDGSMLRATDQFIGPDVYPFADTVYRMIQGGFLNACSVGFLPTEWEMSETGVNFLKQGLLEHSICPVPAHPEALVIARSKGIDVAPLKAWAEKTLDLMKRGESILTRKQVETLRAQADPTGRKVFSVLSELKVAKTSVPRETIPEAKATAEALPETHARVTDELDEQILLDGQPIAIEASAEPVIEPVVVEAKDSPLDVSAAAGVVPMSPVGPTPVPDDADDAEERAAFQTMASMLSDASDVLEQAASDVAGLLAVEQVEPTPNPAEDAEEANENRVMNGVLSVCQTIAEQVAVIASSAQSILDDSDAINAGPGAASIESAEDRVAKVFARVEDVDPVRWNKSLSKAFDVTREQIPAGDIEQALAARFIDCDVKALSESRFQVASARMGSFLKSLDEQLVDCDVEDIRNTDWDGKEVPPTWEMIRLNSKIEQDFLVDGMRFLTWEHEEFHGIKMCLRVTPAWYGLDVTTYIERDKKGAMERFVSDVQERAAGLKYLKGEAFNISGEFLERGSEGFDEVFLAPENAKAIKRVATLIEEKGADFDNRGLMVVGPPGTGKTLTGRLLLNNSKSTFIWVAARDFARMGAFGGMVHAFEMARELAPSIIFVEDVDNWLDGYTVDMLKSEMDGIRQTKGVVTILTTNYPELLPKALIDRPGRFHDVLKFDLPDDVARKQMLARWLPGLDAVDTIKAVDATAGYSGAHVRELCRFASIIQEQDGLALTAALDAALTKLADQRDLITSVQATGSRYRAASWVSKRFGPQGKSHTEASLMLKHRTLSLCAGDRRATTETKAAISVALADLDEAVQVLKAGRVLSSANEQRIRNATALLDEVLATLQTATEAPAEVIPPATDGPADPLPITMGRALDDNEQVLVLDEEKDIDLAISPDLIRSALKAAISEQLMLVTGRVD